MSEFKLESETLPTDEELAGYEELDFVEGIKAMVDEGAALIPWNYWGWDDRCVILFDFRDFADDDGYFKVVQPDEVWPTGGFAYREETCVRGEYRFTAWEMMNLKFRKVGPWYYHLWKKLTTEEKGTEQ